MSADDMTPAEVGRHLGRIEDALKQGFADIKLDLSNYLLKSVHEAEMRAIAEKFSDHASDVNELRTALAAEEASRKAFESQRYITTKSMWGAIGVLAALVMVLLAAYGVFADLIPRLAQ